MVTLVLDEIARCACADLLTHNDHFTVHRVEDANGEPGIVIDTQVGSACFALRGPVLLASLEMFGRPVGAPSPVRWSIGDSSGREENDVSHVWIRYPEGDPRQIVFGITRVPESRANPAVLCEVHLGAYSGIVTVALQITNTTAESIEPHFGIAVDWDDSIPVRGGTLATADGPISWRELPTAEMECCRPLTPWIAFDVAAFRIDGTPPPPIRPGARLRSELEFGLLSHRASGSFRTALARQSVDQLGRLGSLDAESR